jgi:hypothetical protein
MLDTELQTIAIAWLAAGTTPKRNKVAKQLEDWTRGTKEYNCRVAMENHDVPRVTARSIPYGEERIAMYEAIKAGERAGKAKPSAKKAAKPAKAAKPSASVPADDVAMITAIATEAAVAAVQSYFAKK